jgi:hypothetical protein
MLRREAPPLGRSAAGAAVATFGAGALEAGTLRALDIELVTARGGASGGRLGGASTLAPGAEPAAAVGATPSRAVVSTDARPSTRPAAAASAIAQRERCARPAATGGATLATTGISLGGGTDSTGAATGTGNATGGDGVGTSARCVTFSLSDTGAAAPTTGNCG